MKEKRREILQKLVHFLTAFTIFLKAIVKLDHPHGYWPLILFLFAAAAYIVTITIFHARFHHHARLIDASVLAIECAIMAIIAVLYVREGAHWLPYLMGFASLGFLVAMVVRLTRRTP